MADNQSMSGVQNQTTSKKARVSWMFFDWAAQPFHTIILTFIFGPYFTHHLAANGAEAQAAWGMAVAIGGLSIAFLAPILGAISDATGPRKPYIAFFSVLAIVGAFALYFAVPGTQNAVLIALVGLVVAMIGFEFAAIFNNAMMPDLVTREELGELSGNGWALGYAGGVTSLIFILAFMATSDAETGKTIIGLDPIFGLDGKSYQGDRASGPFTSIWYIIFVVPLFLFVPDAKKREHTQNAVSAGLKKLVTTIRTLPERRSYFAFLLSSLFYRDGLNALYTFGGIYAAGVLGLSVTQVGIFGIIAALAGVFGALIGGKMDKRFGPKPVVGFSCFVLVVACLLVVSTTQSYVFFAIPVAAESSAPLITFYIAGTLIGAFGGAIQAASRTLLVHQVEHDEVTEAFGLYAFSGRATTFIGPLSVAAVTAWTGSQQLGISPVVILMLLGLIGLFFVKQKGSAQ